MLPWHWPQSLPGRPHCPLFAIGSRKSKIANVVVPVVQRIEQGFPKGKTAFLLDFADVISSEQMTAFRRVE
jgi:hypothetical protein